MTQHFLNTTVETVERALNVAFQAGHRLCALSLPAPPKPLADVFEALPDQIASLWKTASPHGPIGEVGLGAAVRLEAGGEGRFHQIREAAEPMLADLFRVELGAKGAPPRFYGGFSFSHLETSSAWSCLGFAQALFVLPRWVYSCEGHIASLTLNVSLGELQKISARRAIAQETVELMAKIAAVSPEPPCVSENPGALRASAFSKRERPDLADWSALLETARISLEKKDLDKIVLARMLELSFDTAPSIAGVIARLVEVSEDSTVFAFRAGANVFLGATPERLIARNGNRAFSEALAGSISSEFYGAANLLESDEKELREHAYVVREISDRLFELGARIDPRAKVAPATKALRHVIHLWTPIEAEFSAAPPHVLELVEKLHPTPAVGGTPTRDALRFLQENEPIDRGWYAGPVGWFDGAGDGDFVVALRSGLFSDKRVSLFAGVGLVAGFDTQREWDETRLKLNSLLEALSLN